MGRDKKDNLLKTQIDDNLRRIFQQDSEADLPPSLLGLLALLDEDGEDTAGKDAGSDSLSGQPPGLEGATGS